MKVANTTRNVCASNTIGEQIYDDIVRDCAPDDWIRCGAESEKC